MKNFMEDQEINNVRKRSEDSTVQDETVNVPTTSCAIEKDETTKIMTSEKPDITPHDDKKKTIESTVPKAIVTANEAPKDNKIEPQGDKKAASPGKGCVNNKSNFEEPGAGWGSDDNSSTKTRKGDNISASRDTTVKNKELEEMKEKRSAYHKERSRSPIRDRLDKGNYNQYQHNAYNRRSRSRESARAFVRPADRKQESRSPPRRSDERSNSGRYDYITKRGNSPSRESNIIS